MSLLHDVAARTLRLLPPETAHRLSLRALRSGFGPRAAIDDPRLATSLAGLAIPNPIGLAAGFDKDARAPRGLLSAGFGFVECGTVTPSPQSGNARPRLFRLSADRAVINRMGFNNAGLEKFAMALEARRTTGVVGANIGAGRHSADRIGDYSKALSRLQGLADYFTINVSSPNTPGLRNLQSKDALEELLTALDEVQPSEAPLFLKVAPDLEAGQVEEIVEAAVRHRLAGLIIGNTTLARPSGLRSSRVRQEGGLSGPPLMAASTRLLAEFHSAGRGRLVLIGVGGVSCAADVYAKIRAGAAAIQLYTALVFEGPSLIVRIAKDLSERLATDGFSNVAEAVGTG
ncbi:MAG: quinone-dependent dihydroorotate dehydrogenase [Caulobacteraceae bacterium]